MFFLDARAMIFSTFDHVAFKILYRQWRNNHMSHLDKVQGTPSSQELPSFFRANFFVEKWSEGCPKKIEFQIFLPCPGEPPQIFCRKMICPGEGCPQKTEVQIFLTCPGEPPLIFCRKMICPGEGCPQKTELQFFLTCPGEPPLIFFEPRAPMKNLYKGFRQSVTPLFAGGPFWYSCRGAHNLKLRHCLHPYLPFFVALSLRSSLN